VLPNFIITKLKVFKNWSSFMKIRFWLLTYFFHRLANGRIGYRASSEDYTWCQFHQHSMSNFYMHRSWKCKKRQSSCQSFLRFQDLWVQKLLVERLWNWPQLRSRGSGVLEQHGRRSSNSLNHGLQVRIPTN